MRVLVVLLVGLLLAGCGDREPAPTAARTDSDPAFATELMHRDAALLNLLDVALGRRLPPDLVAATEQLRLDATERMETAADLLESWDREVPTTVRDHSVEHSSDAQVPELAGMTTGDDLQRIAPLHGTRFGRAFVALLTGTLEATRDLAAGHDGPEPAAAELAGAAATSCTTALAAL